MVNYRFLGNSGLKVSEITYGNWVTHASQVEDDAAVKTVHAALDAGITTFDTADTYANTAAETILGTALAGQRRESLEIFTKVYFPTGPKGANDTGLSRKHIMDSVNGSLKRLGTDYIDLYQAHRFDYETPLEETFQAFADIVRQGKALYIGVSEWTAEQLREGHALAKQLGIQLISNQPQYSMLHRVIEGKVVPGFIKHFLRDDLLEAVQRLKPVAAEAGLTMPQLAIAWVLQNQNVAAALVGASRPEQLADTVKASGVTLDADTMTAIDTALDGFVNDDPEHTYSVSPKARLV
jgi:aryl-alcohol dehydrogenase-like predicted oxidoreductase